MVLTMPVSRGESTDQIIATIFLKILIFSQIIFFLKYFDHIYIWSPFYISSNSLCYESAYSSITFTAHFNEELNAVIYINAINVVLCFIKDYLRLLNGKGDISMT